MSRLLGRRDAMLGGALTLLIPGLARGVLPGGAQQNFTLDVFDVGGFDPIVRRDADGRIVRHNLVFRTLPLDTPRTGNLLDDFLGSMLGELTFRWEPAAGSQSLSMYGAKLADWNYVALAQQGRGQNYDEFLVAVDSTRGTLRRREAQQTLVADYRVTQNGGVIWNRYTE
jgi:hypothetical protein